MLIEIRTQNRSLLPSRPCATVPLTKLRRLPEVGILPAFFFMSTDYIGETVQRLHEIIEPVLERESLELIDLEYTRVSRGYLLRLYIDRVGEEPYPSSPASEASNPVGIKDCTRVSRELAPLLDVEDVIPGAYTFEVSSPGLNRRLKTPSHFARALGTMVRVKTRVMIANTKLLIAPLLEADCDHIVLEYAGERVEIPYRLIARANLEYQF